MNKKLTKEERKQQLEIKRSQPREITMNDIILLQEHFGYKEREKKKK